MNWTNLQAQKTQDVVRSQMLSSSMAVSQAGHPPPAQSGAQAGEWARSVASGELTVSALRKRVGELEEENRGLRQENEKLHQDNSKLVGHVVERKLTSPARPARQVQGQGGCCCMADHISRNVL